MADWLDDYSSFGVKLSEGDKVLMRFAIAKERERIIKLLLDGWVRNEDAPLIKAIKGENE